MNTCLNLTSTGGCERSSGPRRGLGRCSRRTPDASSILNVVLIQIFPLEINVDVFITARTTNLRRIEDDPNNPYPPTPSNICFLRTGSPLMWKLSRRHCQLFALHSASTVIAALSIYYDNILWIFYLRISCLPAVVFLVAG